MNQQFSTLKKSEMTEIEIDDNVSDIIEEYVLKTKETVLSAQRNLKEIAGNNKQLIKKSLEKYCKDNNTSRFNLEPVKSFILENELKSKGASKCAEEEFNHYFGKSLEACLKATDEVYSNLKRGNDARFSDALESLSDKQSIKRGGFIRRMYYRVASVECRY